jgi:antitoxin component YwqK of YwqJK toxin-antitoxin module
MGIRKNIITYYALCFFASVGSCQNINNILSNQNQASDLMSFEEVFSDTTFLNDTTIYVRFFKYNGIEPSVLRTHFFSFHDSKWVLDGITQTFINNKLNTIINFKLGLRDGEMLYFDQKGKYIDLQTNYLNDTINGLTISYYVNGQIKQFGKCFGSLTFRYGEWLTYHENGKLKSRGNYGLFEVNNKDLIIENVQVKNPNFNNFENVILVRVGNWAFYDEAGNLEKTEFLETPEIVLTKDW